MGVGAAARRGKLTPLPLPALQCRSRFYCHGNGSSFPVIVCGRKTSTYGFESLLFAICFVRQRYAERTRVALAMASAIYPV
jgi:hypothetical protein